MEEELKRSDDSALSRRWKCGAGELICGQQKSEKRSSSRASEFGLTPTYHHHQASTNCLRVAFLSEWRYWIERKLNGPEHEIVVFKMPNSITSQQQSLFSSLSPIFLFFPLFFSKWIFSASLINCRLTWRYFYDGASVPTDLGSFFWCWTLASHHLCFCIRCCCCRRRLRRRRVRMYIKDGRIR